MADYDYVRFRVANKGMRATCVSMNWDAYAEILTLAPAQCRSHSGIIKLVRTTAQGLRASGFAGKLSAATLQAVLTALRAPPDKSLP